MIEQLSIWENVKPYFKLDKPIRLIELFAGIGSQHQAIKNLGLEINRSTICEWSIQSTQAYNDIHVRDYSDYSKGKSKDELIAILSGLGVSSDYNAPMSAEQLKRKPEAQLRTIYNNIIATHNLVNIMTAKGDDLNIAETDKYTYIMTYSFPCQDLSLAGKQAGMARGGGTRSGLLWEVERLLKETKNLPQILLMENVPDVIGTNNIKHFQEWEMWLASIGYSNYCEILNAKDYGIPQNRNRAFMVSILGDYLYRFPQKQELKLRLKDMLESEVDEKYYLSEKIISGFKEHSKKHKEKGNGFIWKHKTKNDIANTLTARSQKCGVTDNAILEPILQLPGYERSGRVYDENGLSPTINAIQGGGQEPKILQKASQKGMIQKIKTAADIGVVVNEPNLKAQMANTLIEQGKVRENDVIRHSYTKSRMNGKMNDIQENNMSPTIDTRADCLGVVIKDKPRVIGGIGDKKSNNGTQWYQQDRIYDNEIAIATTTAFNPNYIDKQLRIRKLTPKECWRLMGFKDEQFDLAQQHQSNSTLYHQAGDSIVVNVLEAIFKQLKGE